MCGTSKQVTMCTLNTCCWTMVAVAVGVLLVFLIALLVLLVLLLLLKWVFLWNDVVS